MSMDTNVNETQSSEPAEPKAETDVVSLVKLNCPAEYKKHSKDEKARKKDMKGIEYILKGLGQFDNEEEKLRAMCKKYTEIVDENRKFQQTIKQMEKKVTMIQREKDQIYAERNKAFLTRSNLESLCRELQKQNKSVKEESLLKIREEEEKRKEVSAKFQNMLAEITALMNLNNEENAKLHEDKMELTKKFNVMHEQMEKFEKLHKEIKLKMTEEKEALLKEKQQLLFKLAQYDAQVQEHQATEAKLRSKISMYNDKYDEFQNALTKSNEVFGGFNEEMEKMSKKILKLEKETSVWKQRWENTHTSLLEVTTYKQIKEAEIATLNRKCSLLQELCRGFQQERATLIAQLKEKNRNESESADYKSNISDKMVQLSNECKELQQDLEALSQQSSDNQKTESSCETKEKGEEKNVPSEKAVAEKNVCLEKSSDKGDKVSESTDGTAEPASPVSDDSKVEKSSPEINTQNEPK